MTRSRGPIQPPYAGCETVSMKEAGTRMTTHPHRVFRRVLVILFAVFLLIASQ
jgi:hypothetical protein